MTLSNGRHYLAIPGPSVMPDRVLRAMHRPAPNIYTGELLELTHGLVPDLKALAGLGEGGRLAMYISNGHGLWEASLSNMISRGDKVLVLVTGTFGSGWAGVARALGAEVEVIDFGLRDVVEAGRVEAALRADRAHEFRAVLMTHVDTAGSMRNDVAAVRAAMDAAGHPALLAVDAIASLGCEEFHMDAWGVDVMIAASQKGLMTPPGMGFVWFNDRALAAGAGADLRTPYWDWTIRSEPRELYEFFDGTAPTHHLYGLRAAMDMIAEEGLGAVWARHGALARAYWAAIEHWGQRGNLALNVADRAHRSHAVTTVSIDAPQGTAIRDWVSEHAGVTLGISLGMAGFGDPAWHGFFRIGHMGHVNAQMVLGVCGAIEAALEALGLDYAPGGVGAAARVIAQA